jgi:hypothetical protein
LLAEFYQYMKNNGSSESHMNNSLKTNMAFAAFIGSDTSFYDIHRKEKMIEFSIVIWNKSILFSILSLCLYRYPYFSIGNKKGSCC